MSKANLKETPEGCILWDARLNEHGYGKVVINHKQTLAHRLFWEVANGPVPDGLELDHLCRNRACVNPEHLEAVSHRVNVLRGISPAAQHARKTHCKNGHEFTATNRSDRSRVCMPCRAAADRRRYWRRKEAS